MSSIEMAKDLSALLDDGATRRVVPVVGRSSAQNLIDLQYLRGVDLGVVRLDAFEGQPRTAAESLTYVARLNPEKVHVLAPLSVSGVHDLVGKRVSFADTAVPAGPALFALLGVKVDPVVEEPHAALESLRKRRSAASVFIGAAPIPTLAALRSGDGFRLLSISPRDGAPSIYSRAQLTSDEYPALVVGSSVNSVGVETVLFAAPLARKSERYANVAGFVEALFSQFPRLKQPPYQPAWKEIDIAAEPAGLRRFPPAEAWLERNAPRSSADDPSEEAMRALFSKFLEERSRSTGRDVLSQNEREQIFGLFLDWMKSQKQ